MVNSHVQKRMIKAKPKSKAKKTFDYWKYHDSYRSNRFGFENLLTRSQTAFNRIKNDDSDLNLFCDPLMHEPMDKPHILVVLKGQYGCIPRTIITRSTLQHLEITKGLCNRLDEYKDKNLKQEHIQDLKEYKQEKIAKREEQLPKSDYQPKDEQQPKLDDQQMDESEDPNIKKKLIEELKEYQQEHMTKTPAHDEEQPKSEDQPMDQTEAEEEQPLTKQEWIQEFNAAEDFYSGSNEKQGDITKTSAPDKKQPKTDDQPMDKTDDQPMGETEALQVQEERKEEKMEVEQEKPLTKEEWIKKFNAASDYYSDTM